MPSQIINKTGKHFEIVFQADVPSFAIHIYAIVPSEEQCQIKTDLKISGHTLENSKYRVIFNKNGDLAFLLDKELNKQLITSPIKLAMLHDTGSLAYPSWELRKEDIDKDAYCYANTPKFEIIENGPARIAIKLQERPNIQRLIKLFLYILTARLSDSTTKLIGEQEEHFLKLYSLLQVQIMLQNMIRV